MTTGSGGTTADASGRAALADHVQRAAGVIAARNRGDFAGAEALLADFTDPQARTIGFFVLAELSLQMLCQSTGESLDDVVRGLALDVASSAGI